MNPRLSPLLAIHRKTVEAIVRRSDQGPLHTQTRQYGGMIRDLPGLAVYLTFRNMLFDYGFATFPSPSRLAG